MIGLRRHTVRLVAHRPGWLALGKDACRSIGRVCGELLVDIQHVGSTAVPGLPAKPILDIAGVVANPQVVPEMIDRLTAEGAIYRGDSGESGGHLFVWESSPQVRTIHLHVVPADGMQWRDYLRFRDILRKSPRAREAYAELKRELAARFAYDRGSYTEGKHSFIERVLKDSAPGPEAE